ncbi:MAG: transcriptional regulator, partial [Eubacterium sp.]
IDFWPPLEDDNTELNDKDKKEISKILDNTREQLTSQEGLMFDGEPASEEGVQSILDALELGLEIAKKRNKEKYTPKKYRK